MKNKVVVFDFDKTLTYSDTLMRFFINSSEKRITLLYKMPLYLTAMILAKTKIISNTTMKKFGVLLFLKNMDANTINEVSKNYALQIKCNKLYNSFNFNSNSKIIIITASFSSYVKHLFPKNVLVLGSELVYRKDRVRGLKYNCYGKYKTELLLIKGVNHIDVFYTDSKSDLPLVEISSKTIIVNRDDYKTCYSSQEFLRQF